jgi:hypothetical protein
LLIKRGGPTYRRGRLRGGGTAKISGGTIIAQGGIGVGSGGSLPVTSLTNAVVIVHGGIADTSGSPLSGAAINGTNGVLASTADVTVNASGVALDPNKAIAGTVTFNNSAALTVPPGLTLTVPPGWTVGTPPKPAGSYPGQMTIP